MEEAWQHLIVLGANQIEALLQRFQREKEALQGWMSGREEGRRDSENVQAGSMKALQRVVWSLVFLVFGVRMAKAEELEIQAQKMSEKTLIQIP